MRWPFFIVAVLTESLLAQPATRPFADFKQEVTGVTEKFEMVAIKGGKLTLAGTPDGKPREVEVKDFYIGKTELTWEFFDPWYLGLDMTPQEKAAAALPGAERLRPGVPMGAPDAGFGHAGFPAIRMTHHSATLFCQWLSQKTGRKYRLPTEAEWEYAARAGGSHEVDEETLGKVAWHNPNSNDKTQPVGKLAANRWGLHDMLGNVAEWCDGMDGKPLVRGGSWMSRSKAGRNRPPLNYAWRDVYTAVWHEGDPQRPPSKWWFALRRDIGFRVVCEP